MNFLPSDSINSFQTGRDKVDKRFYAMYRPGLRSKFACMADLKRYLARYSDDTAAMLENASWVLRRRFTHAYGAYTVRENWIAALCGRFIWKDLAAKVLPEDILAGESAACSQVSIVFIELCRSMGLPARKVALKGHFAAEVKYGGKWYYFDLDMKPDFCRIGGRKSLDAILRQKQQYELYRENAFVDAANVTRIFSSVQYGSEHEYIAAKAARFHIVSKWLSHWIWTLFFAAAVLFHIRSAGKPARLRVIVLFSARHTRGVIRLKRVSALIRRSA
ncbi:transglutaminase domain-containing protein [Rurimicrobium arvi]|uniref:Transglutaminase-like domain-containing protein n=1 Tax=Rurimicrobium arvi TaxID=2049916 RepID=A0ABP8MTN1_9BACT